LRRIQIAIGAGIAAALGAIAATVWVGLAVREDTVVAHPYEDGLRQDAERHARAALGLAVRIPEGVEAGVAPLPKGKARWRRRKTRQMQYQPLRGSMSWQTAAHRTARRNVPAICAWRRKTDREVRAAP
jgi:hypothetical protein